MALNPWLCWFFETGMRDAQSRQRIGRLRIISEYAAGLFGLSRTVENSLQIVDRPDALHGCVVHRDPELLLDAGLQFHSRQTVEVQLPRGRVDALRRPVARRNLIE
jgi:hypothetical protein